MPDIAIVQLTNKYSFTDSQSNCSRKYPKPHIKGFYLNPPLPVKNRLEKTV